jgi:hypothetical protein
VDRWWLYIREGGRVISVVGWVWLLWYYIDGGLAGVKRLANRGYGLGDIMLAA